MTAPTELLVIDPDFDFAQDVANVLPDVDVLHAPDEESARHAVASGTVAVVVPGPNLAFDDAIALYEEFRAGNARLGAVVVTRRPTGTQLRHAMRAGVSDVLAVGAVEEELSSAVDVAWPDDVDIPSVPAAAAEVPQPVGKVVTVFSPKGGAGKSTVSANLAVLFAKRGQSVALVDLDLQFGDCTIMFQVRPRVTISDAVPVISELRPSDLPDYMTPHESGVHILAGPAHPSLADAVEPEHVGQLLRLLRETYDVVIVDTPAMFTDHVLSALDHTDELVLLGGFDVPSIKNLRLALSTLTRLGIDASAIHLVMSRVNAKVGLRLAEVENTLGATIDVGIPSDREVPISLNHGVPLAIEHPRSAVVQAIDQIAARILGDPVEPMPIEVDDREREPVHRRLLRRSSTTASTSSA